MNDISPNAIFLSSAFEPSPEELRAFVRAEKERSRPVYERKQPVLVLRPNPPAPRPPPPPPAEIVDLSSDEELPDFSQILAQSKKEGMFEPFASYTHTRAQEEAGSESQGGGLCICKFSTQGLQCKVLKSTFIAGEASNLRYPRHFR